MWHRHARTPDAGLLTCWTLHTAGLCLSNVARLSAAGYSWHDPRMHSGNPTTPASHAPQASDFQAVVMQVQPEALQGLGISPALLTPSRSNGFLTLLQRMRKLAAGLHKPLPSFPSLLTSADSTTPQGAFAQAQDRYLKPDTATVDRLVNVSLALEPAVSSTALPPQHAIHSTSA